MQTSRKTVCTRLDGFHYRDDCTRTPKAQCSRTRKLQLQRTLCDAITLRTRYDYDLDVASFQLWRRVRELNKNLSTFHTNRSSPISSYSRDI